MKRILLLLLVSVSAAFGQSSVTYNNYDHKIKKPPTSAGSAYDYDFTGLTLHGISGGAITPGGSDQQFQWNNAGALDGTAIYTTSGSVVTVQADKVQYVQSGAPSAKFNFDGSHIATSSNRNIRIPDANCSLVIPDNGASNNFLTAIANTGVISKAQPTIGNLANLSGTSKLTGSSSSTTGIQEISLSSNLVISSTTLDLAPNLSFSSLSLTGSIGNGFIDLASQSSPPSTPAGSHVRLYYGSAPGLAWEDSTGFTRTFKQLSPTISANRFINLPDADTSIPIFGQIITFTGPTAPHTITLPDSDFIVPFTGEQVVGNANATWGPTSTVLRINAAMTANKNIILPAASAFSPGTRIVYIDHATPDGSAFIRTFTAAGADFVNGGLTYAPFAGPGTVELETDGSGAWSPVHDSVSVASIRDLTDPSKQLQFDLSGITTATTRTWTVPNVNTSIPVFGQTITFSGPTAARTVTFPDASFTAARTDAANTFTGTQTVGALVATSVNGNTITTGTGTLTLGAGKTTTFDHTSTFTTTDAQTYTFPTTSATLARTDAANTFTGTQTFTAPVLGTPASVNLTNGTALPVSGITASTSTALGVGSIELGHASDTTIARVGAGIMSVEGIEHPSHFFIRAASTVTQGNDNSAHAIFTTPTNGRITLPVSGVYAFRGYFSWTAMSLTSGNIKVDVLGAGTASTTAWQWQAVGSETAAGSAGALAGGTYVTSASAASIVTATTNATCNVAISGTVDVTTAGTIIPTQTLVTAAQAVLGVGSHFEMWRIAPTGATSAGPVD